MDEATARARLRYLELKAKAGGVSTSTEPEKGAGRVFAEGIVRGIPKALDFVGGVGGEVVNQAAGAVGLPKAPFGEIYKATTYGNDAVSRVLGPESDKGLFTKEGAAGFAGEMVGTLGAGPAVRTVRGLINGLGGSLDNWVRDPSKLQEAYKAWEAGLESTEFAKNYLKENLVQPFLEKMKFDLPTMRDPKAIEAVDAVKAVGGLPNARYLEGARRNLSGNPTPAAQVGRQQIDETLEGAGVGTEGRNAYRRFMDYKDLNYAMRNKGNERIQATRTKINNMDETGMSAAEIAAKRSAGTQGIGETALRAFDGVGNVVLSGLSTVGAGPVAGMAQYLTGKGLGRLGDMVAERKIRALQDVLLNQRATPNMGEKVGAKLREVLMKGFK